VDPNAESAWDENSQPVGAVEFDYDEVSRRLEEDLFDPDDRELDSLTPQEAEKALKCIRWIVRWLWQDGMKNTDGLTIRAILVCWIFIEELRPLSMSDMARGFGCRDKQSLGRWHDHLKACAPWLRTSHMRYETNPETDQSQRAQSSGAAD
jgi:hypothetical protein